MDWLARKDFTLLFVDGNHENYDLLAEFPVQMWHGGKVQMIRENVIHLMRGQMFNLQGRRFFTFGGAMILWMGFWNRTILSCGTR